MMTEQLKKLLDQYENLEWEHLVRTDKFTGDSSFLGQKVFFDDFRVLFDTLISSRTILQKRLPSNELQKLERNLSSFLDLVNRISIYSDAAKHDEVVEDIKRSFFAIKTDLKPLLDYADIDPDERIDAIKQEFARLEELRKGVKEAVDTEMQKLRKGVKETNQGKVQIAGEEIAVFFDAQANAHEQNANKKEVGWIYKRDFLNTVIIWVIAVTTGLYVLSFVGVLIGWLSTEQWKAFWDLRVGALVIALLTILYTGLYFTTKNYNREKDLEYENKNKANVANTMLKLSANATDKTEAIIVSEASKTLFAPINSSDRQKDRSGSQNMNISVPAQGIPQMLNGGTDK